jgi:hypothetical protein
VPETRRTTGIRIGRRIQLPSGPLSTIQTFSATGFSVTRGGYMRRSSIEFGQEVEGEVAGLLRAKSVLAEQQPFAVPVDRVAERG